MYDKYNSKAPCLVILVSSVIDVYDWLRRREGAREAYMYDKFNINI